MIFFFFCLLKQLDHKCKERLKEKRFYIVLDIISMVMTVRLLCLIKNIYIYIYLWGKNTSKAGKVAKESDEFKTVGLV